MFQVAYGIFHKGFAYNFLFLTWCLAGGILRSIGAILAGSLFLLCVFQSLFAMQPSNRNIETKF